MSGPVDDDLETPDDDLESSDSDPSEEEDLGPGDEEVGDLEFAEALGATVDQAIQKAIEILGAQEDEVEIQILEQGSRPFLGIGRAKPYRVRVSWREDLDEEVFEEEIPDGEPAAPSLSTPTSVLPESAAYPSQAESRAERASESVSAVTEEGDLLVRAKALGTELLTRMGFQAEVSAEQREDEILLRIACEDDDALLIGRRGETRAALQQVLQRLLFPRGHAGPQLFVDINDYWERRMQRLRDEALELAERAIDEHVEQHTAPLPPEERRIVHRTLANHPGIRTESEGEGVLKRVSIRAY